MRNRGRLVRNRWLTRLGVIFPGERLLPGLPIRRPWLRFRHRSCCERLALRLTLRPAGNCPTGTHDAPAPRTAPATAATASATTPTPAALRPVAALRPIRARLALQRRRRRRGCALLIPSGIRGG